MAEAKARRLALVQQQLNGEPVVIKLRDKAALKILQLASAKVGAEQVAQAALNVCKAIQAKWQEAITNEIDAREVTVPEGWGATWDAGKGTITIAPAKEA